MTSPRHDSRPPADEPIRVGIIGLGRSGLDIHARALSRLPGFVLVRAADVSDAAAERARHLLDCQVSRDLMDVIGDPYVQVVVIAVQSHLHGPMGLAALRAGKHVIMEKPFASSVAEADELFREAGERCVLAPYHNRRFDPEVVALREILDRGILGDLVSARVSRQIYRRRDDWQTLREFGGGELRNWGAHLIDWCLHLFGKELVFSGGDLVRVLSPGDAEDSIHLLFHTESGARLEVESTSCVTRPLPRWQVVGRYGTAVSTNQKSFLVRFCDPERLTPLLARVGAAGYRYGVQEDLGFQDEEVLFPDWDPNEAFYRDFESCLRGGTSALVTREEVIAQLRLIEEADRLPVRHLVPDSPDLADVVSRSQEFASGVGAV